jgi:hypothetical protein
MKSAAFWVIVRRTSDGLEEHVAPISGSKKKPSKKPAVVYALILKDGGDMFLQIIGVFPYYTVLKASSSYLTTSHEVCSSSQVAVCNSAENLVHENPVDN